MIELTPATCPDAPAYVAIYAPDNYLDVVNRWIVRDRSTGDLHYVTREWRRGRGTGPMFQREPVPDILSPRLEAWVTHQQETV